MAALIDFCWISFLIRAVLLWETQNTCKIQNGRQGAPKWPTGSGNGSNPRILAISSHFRKISFLIRALPLWEKVATEKKMEKMENGMENKGRNSGHYVVASRPPIGDRLQRRRSCQKTMTWTLDSPPLLKSLSFFLESKNDDFDSPPSFLARCHPFYRFFLRSSLSQISLSSSNCNEKGCPQSEWPL